MKIYLNQQTHGLLTSMVESQQINNNTLYIHTSEETKKIKEKTHTHTLQQNNENEQINMLQIIIIVLK